MIEKQKNIFIGIYKIISPSGKIYIGQSTDVENRWEMYERLACKQQLKLYNSLKKYGPKNHIFDKIEECSVDKLIELEIYYKQQVIDKFGWENALFHHIYDLGTGGPMSEETKQKISKSNKGRIFSDETKQKIRNSPNRKENISKAKLGKPNPNAKLANQGNTYRRGKTMSDETKQKIGISNEGRKHSLETRKGMGSPKGGKHSEKSIEKKIKSLNKVPQ